MTKKEFIDNIAIHLRERMLVSGMGKNDLKPGLDLVQSGLLDSMGFVDLLGKLEQEYGIQLNLEDAFERGELTTVRTLLEWFGAK